MEKYTKFGDKKTGANPFVPVWAMGRRDTESLKSWILLIDKIFMPFLVCCRLILLFIAALLYCVLEIVTEPIFSPQLRYWARKRILYFPCRLALFAFGILWIRESIPEKLNLYCNKKRKEYMTELTRVCVNGNIVISNYTSFIDIIYLNMSIYPVFSFPHVNGSLSTVSFFRALRYSCHFQVIDGSGKFQSLVDAYADVKAKRCGPLVLLLEGAKTNNTCILAWKKEAFFATSISHISTARNQSLGTSILNILKNDVHLVAISYLPTSPEKIKYSARYYPPHTVYWWGWHIIYLCSKWKHYMSVTWLDNRKMNLILDGMLQKDNLGDILNGNEVKIREAVSILQLDVHYESKQTSHLDVEIVAIYLHYMQIIMSRMLHSGCIVADVNPTLLQTFSEYFTNTQRKMYIKNR